MFRQRVWLILLAAILALALVTSASAWFLLPQGPATTPIGQAPTSPLQAQLSLTQSVTPTLVGPLLLPPAPAQAPNTMTDTHKPIPQKGGMLRQAITEDADTLNPLLTTNPTSQLVARQLFPRLVDWDAQTGLITTTALAERWVVTDSGPTANRAYTFYLRHNLFWSDGQPVTAQDVQFTYAALAAPTVQSPARADVEAIEHIAAPDAWTVVVTFRTANCAALYTLRQPLLPSHHYAADFSDIRSNPLNQAPTVSAGPFRFDQWTPGKQIRLVRNEHYWQGAPLLDGWQFDVMPDAQTQLQDLFGGRVDLIQVKPDLVKKLAFEPTFGVYQAPSNGYSFIALNLADPAQPQPGRDANGERVPQPPHPILGDGRVRQALAQAIDTTRIISEVFPGQGEQVTNLLSSSTAWQPSGGVQPYPFDPAAAQRLLAEAGWQAANQSSVRERNGVSLTLTLLTNQDSPARVRIGELVQQQLQAVGMNLRLQTGDFAQVRKTLLNQSYDMVVIGWDNLGPDPALNAFWHSRDDTPGSGMNFVSLQDAELDQWLDEAAQWPGCSLAARAQRYQQIQQRVHDLVPYIFIASQPTTWAFTSGLRGQLPGPWQLENQVQTWWKIK